MWAGRGVLFIVITQGPRLAEEPSFYEATFSSTDLGGCLGRGREHEEQSSDCWIISLRSHTHHLWSYFIVQGKADGHAFKWCMLGKRGVLKSGERNEWKHEWMNPQIPEWMNEFRKQRPRDGVRLCRDCAASYLLFSFLEFHTTPGDHHCLPLRNGWAE